MSLTSAERRDRASKAARDRWARAFALKRAILENIYFAGMRKSPNGEVPYVVLREDPTDDAIYAALKKEADLARADQRRRRRVRGPDVSTRKYSKSRP